ncbi:ATP synthase F1 subunit gamma [Mucispirillum schaedleri]|mgnify:CR=1 FL=1|jgi:F-type H+-transporting ATPase subunit gamma|uniref:ATP synthase gamma chain n=1 Tax=Mucispirillum schaedleri ASF457 TaxID=1379858 RepID=V2QFW8_9BACT|nr:ATP synthase F1 subunit gamma [Mucispirillum schaedleri]MCX4360502.1 ATP synthase F1 subunit gamma [Mucispirillum schaedleri]USF23631.1 ATP synthase gamma chain [Mucispirillum schaedleri ASF457]SIW05472.1 ATP synthase gamma chain [Mucispirillum schaedleri ASF457]
MASARDIKRKINSVSNTQKITKTMKMVSAAKMRKAIEAMQSARPYTDKLAELIQEISNRAGGNTEHAFFEAKEVHTIYLVVVTSDKGLCGAFNSNVLKAAYNFAKENKDKTIKIVPVGKRAFDFFAKRGFEIVEKWIGFGGKYSFNDAVDAGRLISKSFINGNADEVHLIYNEFKSTSSQLVRIKKLLPLAVESGSEPKYPDFEYEPDVNVLLDSLLPQFINTSIFQSMLESVAGEHGARMVAMDNATRSAGEMIKKLVLNYNKTRQAAITTELLDIVNGAEALK